MSSFQWIVVFRRKECHQSLMCWLKQTGSLGFFHPLYFFLQTNHRNSDEVKQLSKSDFLERLRRFEIVLSLFICCTFLFQAKKNIFHLNHRRNVTPALHFNRQIDYLLMQSLAFSSHARHGKMGEKFGFAFIYSNQIKSFGTRVAANRK